MLSPAVVCRACGQMFEHDYYGQAAIEQLKEDGCYCGGCVVDYAEYANDEPAVNSWLISRFKKAHAKPARKLYLARPAALYR